MITINKVDRARHILEEVLKSAPGADIELTIEMIKCLDKKLPGKRYFIEVSDGEHKMPYSDEFIENMLKNEFENYIMKIGE